MTCGDAESDDKWMTNDQGGLAAMGFARKRIGKDRKVRYTAAHRDLRGSIRPWAGGPASGWRSAGTSAGSVLIKITSFSRPVRQQYPPCDCRVKPQEERRYEFLY